MYEKIMLEPAIRGHRSMYVCICNALSERKIRESASQNGPVRAVADIFRSLGAEPECGKCAAHAVAIYHEEAARQTACA